MANTFLLAKGKPIGVSLAEPDMVDTARRIMDVAAAHNCQILLPQDVVVAVEFKLGAEHRLASSDDVADCEMILDAGAGSVVAAHVAMERVLSEIAEDILVPSTDTTSAIVAWFESHGAIASDGKSGNGENMEFVSEL